MPLADEEVGTRETALTLADLKEEEGEEEEEEHLLPALRPTALQHSCTLTCRRRAYVHGVVTALLRPFGILAVCPSDKTISETVCSSRNDGSAQRNRCSPPFSLVHLIILLLLLLSPLPTAKAFGLGQIRQSRNPTLHRPAAPPAPVELERGVDGTPVEESMVKIRTREVENPPPPPPPGIPLQQMENPAADPWPYNVPPVDSTLQRAAAFPPAFVPNYYYYTFYGTPWNYPETRLLGAYPPSAPPASQWAAQNQNYYPYYHYPRNPASSRRKTGNRRRTEKYKNEKCQKICDACLRSYDGTDVDIDKERAILQQRFALHVKPSMKHKESVEALFKYMDGNNDGSISFTELQNYLLLHNIISPDLPQ